MQIRQRLRPGDIGAIVQLHAEYYAEHWGFGTYFEAKVAAELGAFAQRKAETDLVLLVRDGSGLAGSLILDLNDPASGSRGAHLRWFILSERCRGTGVGRDLMATAMDFADRHTGGAVWLTTFAGLAPARHLYESFGFELSAEAEGEAWGTRVTEQEFRRPARAAFAAQSAPLE